MNRNMNRADARRAEKSRRKIRSGVRTTPNPSVGDLCPVRLSAIDNEQMLRKTWMDCLSELREHLTQIKHGVNIPGTMDAVMYRMGILGMIAQARSLELPCCLEANLNQARIVKFASTLRELALVLDRADKAAASAQGTALVPSLIGLILDGLPSAEDLAGIVNDFPVPFCLCSNCGESYLGAPTVCECRHCHTLFLTGRHSYLAR